MPPKQGIFAKPALYRPTARTGFTRNQMKLQYTLTRVIGTGLMTVAGALISTSALSASICADTRVDANSLNIDASCVLFDGKRYQTKWLPATSSGSLSWLLDPTQLKPSVCPLTATNCGKLDEKFNLTFRDTELNGKKYNINFKAIPDANSVLGLRWDYTTHTPAAIHSKIGVNCSIDQRIQRVSFVHVGDLHARFDLGKDKYSKIRAYFDKVKLENPYAVFTNAGDDLEKGSVAEQISKGQAGTEAILAMAFDVRTLGNHDFGWGEEQLLRHSKDPKALVLSANSKYTGTNPIGFGARDFGVIEVGCLRIGFFGMVSPPWNELDKTYEENYYPSFINTYSNAETAAPLVAANRNAVDVLVMVSHLGIEEDMYTATAVPGIDLVLGGHSHGGPSLQKVGSTYVVQPEFYGDGVTRIDLDIDLASRKIVAFERTEQLVADLVEINTGVHQAIQKIMDTHAPNANAALGYLQSEQDIPGISILAAKAGMAISGANAALIDPGLIFQWRKMPAGAVSAQTLISSYFVEHQPPGTPGLNSMYLVDVKGSDLIAMRQQKPTWTYQGITIINPNTIYKVLIHKGPATNPKEFFLPEVALGNPRFQSETWEALATYASDRQSRCLYLDSDAKPPGCTR